MCKAWFPSQIQNGLRQQFILPDCRHMAETRKVYRYFQSLEVCIRVAWCSLSSETIDMKERGCALRMSLGSQHPDELASWLIIEARKGPELPL